MWIRGKKQTAVSISEGRCCHTPPRRGARWHCGGFGPKSKKQTSSLECDWQLRLSPAHKERVVLKQIIFMWRFVIPNWLIHLIHIIFATLTSRIPLDGDVNQSGKRLKGFLSFLKTGPWSDTVLIRIRCGMNSVFFCNSGGVLWTLSRHLCNEASISSALGSETLSVGHSKC